MKRRRGSEVFATLAMFATLVLSAVLAAGTGCSSSQTQGGAPACKDDRAPANTVFVQGGQSCTLPDGRPGVGMGKHGCVDPTVCDCNPEAGSATCDPGAVCAYAACSGVNQGEACALPGGARGTCCKGVCAELNLASDPSNCGWCGNVCPVGVTCGYFACEIPSGATPTCAPGTVAVSTTCVHSGCVACLTMSCAGIPDGAQCALTADAATGTGMCCNGACVVYDDDQNCGGCGVTCCAGSHCSPRDSTGLGGVCL